jgi:hypothetical protein
VNLQVIGRNIGTGLVEETFEVSGDMATTGRISEPAIAVQETLPEEGGRGGEANDMTCPICLDQIELEELAVVKGCDHVYCGEAQLFYVTLGVSDTPDGRHISSGYSFEVQDRQQTKTGL